MVPVWVVEAVVRGRLPAKPDDKCAFVLQPAQARSVDSHTAHKWPCFSPPMAVSTHKACVLSTAAHVVSDVAGVHDLWQ